MKKSIILKRFRKEAKILSEQEEPTDLPAEAGLVSTVEDPYSSGLSASAVGYLKYFAKKYGINPIVIQAIFEAETENIDFYRTPIDFKEKVKPIIRFEPYQFYMRSERGRKLTATSGNFDVCDEMFIVSEDPKGITQTKFNEKCVASSAECPCKGRYFNSSLTDKPSNNLFSLHPGILGWISAANRICRTSYKNGTMKPWYGKKLYKCVNQQFLRQYRNFFTQYRASIPTSRTEQAKIGIAKLLGLPAHLKTRFGVRDFGGTPAGNWREWEIFELHKQFVGNQEIACNSISTGAGQIMGFNWKTFKDLGIANACDLHKALSSPDPNMRMKFKLHFFEKYKNGKLVKLLGCTEQFCFDPTNQKHWDKFSRMYNGSVLVSKKYAKAYTKLSGLSAHKGKEIKKKEPVKIKPPVGPEKTMTGKCIKGKTGSPCSVDSDCGRKNQEYIDAKKNLKPGEEFEYWCGKIGDKK